MLSGIFIFTSISNKCQKKEEKILKPVKMLVFAVVQTSYLSCVLNFGEYANYPDLKKITEVLES